LPARKPPSPSWRAVNHLRGAGHTPSPGPTETKQAPAKAKGKKDEGEQKKEEFLKAEALLIRAGRMRSRATRLRLLFAAKKYWLAWQHLPKTGKTVGGLGE